MGGLLEWAHTQPHLVVEQPEGSWGLGRVRGVAEETPALYFGCLAGSDEVIANDKGEKLFNTYVEDTKVRTSKRWKAMPPGALPLRALPKREGEVQVVLRGGKVVTDHVMRVPDRKRYALRSVYYQERHPSHVVAYLPGTAT